MYTLGRWPYLWVAVSGPQEHAGNINTITSIVSMLE